MKITEISEKQLNVLTWWCDSSPYKNYEAIICDGAVRSGKTLFMGVSFVMWAMRRFADKKFGICGKTIVSLRRNVISEILPVLTDMGFKCDEKISKNCITVEFGAHENTFYLFGGRDEGSAALIQGITFAGVLMDEAALMPRSFVEQATARCSVTGSKLWFNCNPEGPYHWFYSEWIKKAEERKALYMHFTMDDNPSLSPEIRNRYARMYSGVFYQRFILGQWVAAQGLVYDFFDSSFVQEPPEEPCQEYCISCDYGTVNPASFGLWGKLNGIWYRLREYYYASRNEGRQKTDAEYVRDLKEVKGSLDVKKVIVDPSAASFIEALAREGLPVVKAKNDVVSGIRTTADMLKSGKIVICSTCKDAIREFSLYVWDEKSGYDAPVKKNDHAMDDIRYFAEEIAAESRNDFYGISVERKI